MNYKVYKGLTEDVKKVRIEVFVEEQNFLEEFDEYDATSNHIAFYDEDKIWGICRYFPYKDDGTYKLGRIAIIKEYRGKQLGRFIIKTGEEEIKKLGGKRVILGAQCRAQGFYEKCGYTPYGEVYKEEYCDHIMMEKTL